MKAALLAKRFGKHLVGRKVKVPRITPEVVEVVALILKTKRHKVFPAVAFHVRHPSINAELHVYTEENVELVD